ncbi:HIG1 domain family member 1A, mitochondrial-like [Dendronephthya gigantea]|uniref:HIG1 domain family member 1A, mitochondrial-like n=1 Tax=Dendronephthya gigantea TaxID=151771 RepID=UPI001069D3E1|nr:HIG1 domain family member 1A, mitochondrial-like [Dendronephthya gigantea]
MSARRTPTAEEVAEFASPAVEESETDKLLRKSRDQPFVPLGILGTIGALAYGAYAYKNRGPMSTSRYLMRLRVIAQSMVVGAIMVGVGYTAIKEKREKNK